MSAGNSYISLPPGAVTEGALRLPLLWNGESGLALNKPPGLPAFQDTRVGGGPRSILTELNRRAEAGATQLERLQIQTLFALNLLDREASGILLCAKSHEARASLKNAMGSSRFSFRYHFLTASDLKETELSCDLPVAVHRQKPLALISHRTGKKASTVFRRLEDLGAYSLWESESAYDRFHQVRLHAAEVGVPVLGDSIYANQGRTSVEKRSSRAGAKTVAEKGLFLHLYAVRFPLGEDWVEVEAPYPREFRVRMKTKR